MMKTNNLDAAYWTNRYKHGKTGWDIGEVSSPLKVYIDQLENKNLKILIPGAGNAYEAEYLFNKGFKNVFIADISKEPLANFKERVPNFPEDHLIHSDFFDLDGLYDIILEQTFFCALPVQKRPQYAQKAHQLLKERGNLVGLLFNFELTEAGPPFGGSKKEYLTYFEPNFKIEIFEPCYNSIQPRQGNELFFKFRKN